MALLVFFVSLFLTMSDPLLNEIRGMLVFARVVGAGSFSGAANRIGISRAVVSYQIKQLEQRLGVRLLNRSTRKISMTAAGQTYYQRCKVILEQADRAHSDIHNLREEAVGKVSLACPINLGLHWIVPIANAFRHRYPHIALDINFSESVTDLIQSGTDIAVRSGPLPDSDLHAVKLAELQRCICASPAYFKARSIPQTIEQLQQHQWVVYSRTSNKLTLNKGKTSFTFEISGHLTTNDAAARRQFALAGQGLAVLPIYDAKQAIDNGGLIEVMRDHQLPKLELFAVFPQGATQAKAVQLMLDALKKYPPHKMADIDL